MAAEKKQKTFGEYIGKRPTARNALGGVHVEVYRGGVYDGELRHFTESATIGIEWGYVGSGSEDLALSLLVDVAPYRDAQKHHAAFASEVISELPRHVDPSRDADFVAEWTLGEGEVLSWLASRKPGA